MRNGNQMAEREKSQDVTGLQAAHDRDREGSLPHPPMLRVLTRANLVANVLVNPQLTLMKMLQVRYRYQQIAAVVNANAIKAIMEPDATTVANPTTRCSHGID